MRVAVIGGTGLVGRQTVAALRAKGHDPVVVARSEGVDVTSIEAEDRAEVENFFATAPGSRRRPSRPGWRRRPGADESTVGAGSCGVTTTRTPTVDRRPDRRPELDAIRTLVVGGLVFFHAALVFDESDDFYVKNVDTTSVTTVLAGFAVVWAMPALFLIAGFGSWHSMSRRGPGGFARERLQRLGVPLLFAILTFLPVPVWLRLKAAGPGYHESYLQFLPKFYTVHLDLADFPFVLGGEYFETGHLWFVVLLLAFSLMLAPVARWTPHANRAKEALARAVGRRGIVLLPAAVTSAICAFVGMEEAFAGWSRWAYLLFFLGGFLLASDERFRLAMRRDAVLAAVIAGVVFAVTGPVLLTAGDEPFTAMTAHAVIARALFGFAGWCAVVAILGLLDRRNTKRAKGEPSRAYLYLAVAALPIYVLHQPIVVAIAYGVVRWDAPIFVKYAAIVTASLALTIAAYDLLVRRTRLTRYLFGMRDQETSPSAPSSRSPG
jgi:peptidoglycan/LPS O-acetylase OafA/YrhL